MLKRAKWREWSGESGESGVEKVEWREWRGWHEESGRRVKWESGVESVKVE